MYSFPNFEPVHCSMSSSNCCFLSCIQDSQETGKMVWYSHLFKNFPQFVVIHTVKGFAIISEVYIVRSRFFFSLPLLSLWSNECQQFDLWFFYLFEIQLYIWKFLAHLLLKYRLKDFEHNFARMWNEGNCTVIWAFFGEHCSSLGVEYKLTSSSPVATAKFPKFADVLSATL